MNAVAKQTNYYTIEDIYNLPNGQRAELIDGKLYMMAAPGRIHQRIVMELSLELGNILEGMVEIVKYIYHHLRYF